MTIDEVIMLDLEIVEERLNNLDIDEEELFEFFDIFDKCKDAQSEGYVVSFKKPANNVTTDEIAIGDSPRHSQLDFKPPQVKTPMLAGRAKAPSLSMAPLASSLAQIKPIDADVGVERNLSFNDMIGKISEAGRSVLKDQNLVHETVLARIKDSDINDLDLSQKDSDIIKQLAFQCRVKEQTQGPMTLATSIKNHSIFKIYPLKSKLTFKALKNSGIKSGNQLYLYTRIEQIHDIFREFPSIPDEDKQALMAGIGLTHYARNVIKRNDKAIAKRRK